MKSQLVSSPVAEVATPVVPKSDPTSSAARNEAIDFAKGFLVVTMVVYHALNYFAQQIQWPYPYIKFVSGGFIFISGYIVATFYAAKWTQNPQRVTLRLLTRGLKLLALFTIISLTLSVLSVGNYRGQNYDLDQFFDHALEIYTTGYTRVVAFYILVPIAYLLMLSPLILWLQRYRAALIIVLMAALVSTLLLRRSLNNVTMLLIGEIGVLVGMLAPLGRMSSVRHLPASFLTLVAWVVALPWWQFNLLGYVAYIIIVLKFVADFSELLPSAAFPKKVVCLLGEYVLFCYLGQIFFLQMFQRLFWKNFHTTGPWVLLIMLLTCVILTAASWLLAAARRRYRAIDAAYRLVFA